MGKDACKYSLNQRQRVDLLYQMTRPCQWKEKRSGWRRELRAGLALIIIHRVA